MAEALEGNERRVFFSLYRDHDRDTPDAIRIELTRSPPYLDEDEVVEILEALRDRGYVEEHSLGHWGLSSQGLAVRRSLLGESVPG